MMDNSAMADGAMAGGDMPMVGGAPMDPANDVVTNASKAGNLKTLVAAVGAAGLVDTLKGAGPFTVFAPNDDAFKKLPAGTVETLLKPENKQKLAGILTYHVVSGKLDTAELDKEIAAGGGKAKLKTVAGGSLTVSKDGDNYTLTDATGNKSQISAEERNVYQSNGVAHVIDTVLLPST
nr:fasciclin domain-containing protein [Aquisediminimonas profunda]